MMTKTFEIIATALFALAVLHTFLTARFEQLAHRSPAHAGLWHFAGEVEAVFGIWAFVLMVVMAGWSGIDIAIRHVEALSFTEPMFVFAIMVIAASRPILRLSARGVALAARVLPLPEAPATYLAILIVVPLLGSFVTEPAAMTLAALLLRDLFFSRPVSTRFKYATVGVLFVNISIGGTLTSFAAPPVLMVASVWGWNSIDLFTMFGWKASVAVVINALLVSAGFFRELRSLEIGQNKVELSPSGLTAVHLLCLAGVIVFAHHPAVFLPLFLLFLGVADAYSRHQDRLILREGLMVALFLAGLVVLGSFQKWWLQPLLADMQELPLFFGTLGLTALTDNAALTYLGSLVEGTGDSFRYALVSGAVAGGGLTVIANAPNPAGFAMLRECFEDRAIRPFGLLLAAALPTVVAALAFLLL